MDNSDLQNLCQMKNTFSNFAWQNTKKLHILISNQELMKEDTTHFLLEEVGLLWLSPNSATFTSTMPCLASPRWRNGLAQSHPLFFFSRWLLMSQVSTSNSCRISESKGRDLQ